MTAKLILSMDGVVIKEYPLSQERLTIGRKEHNDIVIDNLAVSGEHAAIITILHDSFLEDLDSTNGVEVNGVATKKHFLHNNDLIEIGKHKLKYITDEISQTSAADFEKTMLMRTPAKQAPSPAKAGDTSSFIKTQSVMAKPVDDKASEKTGKFEARAPIPVPAPPSPSPAAATAVPAAAIQILTGPNAGKELELVKNLTTLGKPGLQVAVLTRRPHGFFITHVEGATFPSVNGQVMGAQPLQMKNHDIIELAGVKMEFYLKG
ncbi:MAG TPA: FHA domain-containing protein [Gallionella sp.]|nr:FHA domain-containing protein [Gallionella sp.]